MRCSSWALRTRSLCAAFSASESACACDGDEECLRGCACVCIFWWVFCSVLPFAPGGDVEDKDNADTPNPVIPVICSLGLRVGRIDDCVCVGE